MGIFTGIAGSIVGGLLGHSAQKSANRTNIRLQREQRDWEEKMSNTAWQRSTRDMLAAGINPMLAVSQGGATTPSVSAATVHPEDALGRGVSSAADKAMQQFMLQQQKANIELTQANTAKATAEASVAKERAGRGAEIVDWEVQKAIAEVQERLGARDVHTQQALIKTLEKELLQKTLPYQVSSAKSRADILTTEVSFNEAKAMLEHLKIPEAKAIADWFDMVGQASPMAKATMSITQWLQIILSRR